MQKYLLSFVSKTELGPQEFEREYPNDYSAMSSARQLSALCGWVLIGVGKKIGESIHWIPPEIWKR